MQKKSRLTGILAPIAAIVIILVIWQLAVTLTGVSQKLIPGPLAIAAALADNFTDVIMADMFISIKNILTGYVIAVPIGFVTAALCSQSKLLTKAMTPLLVILMITPMSTLVPIFKLFLGVSNGLKVLVIVLQTSPVIALNSLTGFANPPANNVDVMKGMGCGKWRIFFKVSLPNALPRVFTGLQLGCILGTIASMTADISVGQGGLGYRVSIYAAFAATPSAFATILIAAIIGVVLFEIVSLIQKLVIRQK